MYVLEVASRVKASYVSLDGRGGGSLGINISSLLLEVVLTSNNELSLAYIYISRV